MHRLHQGCGKKNTMGTSRTLQKRIASRTSRWGLVERSRSVSPHEKKKVEHKKVYRINKSILLKLRGARKLKKKIVSQ